MSLIDNMINSAFNTFRFKDTIFYKENSDLQDRYNALEKLKKEYTNNENLLNELFIIKKGLDGENEIAYQLKKSHIGMYVLRDIKIKHEDLTAQFDYVIITPVFTYYVECKNLIGNITLNENGDFIREYTINGKKIKKGIYSPLRQVEAQREVLRKIWDNNTSTIKKLFSGNNFNYYRKVLVVVANQDTILNTSKAPKNIKSIVLRADSLVRKIEYDINNRNDNEYFDSKKQMEEIAKSYIDISYDEKIDYYQYYKNKYFSKKDYNDNNLKKRLIEFRKKRSNEFNIPAYYIFNNEELEKIIQAKPKTINELYELNILSPIKVKTHGKAIIDEIND